jgi:uncharacterized protein YqeY
MIINGVNFDIDFTDADFIEKIEKASKKLYEEAEKLKQNNQLSLAEGIRQECKILKDFLDYVLGDGTSEKLFEGKDSLKKCLQAFEDIINAKQNYENDFEAKISKYSPDRLKR